MHFLKDILLIDFETTGEDPYKINPTQLGAILLDKDTLEEKETFESFIKADFKGISQEVLDISGITQGQLTNAPTPAEVGAKFYEKFGANNLLASWVQRLDRSMLDKILIAANIDYSKYSYHFLDLWPMAYVYLLKTGYTGSFQSEEMFQSFGLSKRDKHDALDDCRKEAEILRKIMQS